ncbi:hypothetical protein J6590_064931 [Homalodisca vitripennis]|nr:hypothetical protein J6590_064931 [Homalodisca vitripennis]
MAGAKSNKTCHNIHDTVRDTDYRYTARLAHQVKEAPPRMAGAKSNKTCYNIHDTVRDTDYRYTARLAHQVKEAPPRVCSLTKVNVFT